MGITDSNYDNSEVPQRITPNNSPFKITDGSSRGGSTNNNKSSSNDGSDDDKDDPVIKFMQQYSPQLSQLSFGGVMGFCSGLSLKRLGKAAAYVVGTYVH